MMPCTRTELCSHAKANNKRLKKEGQEHVDQNAMAADTSLPHLPDLIVEKIFRLIPTKLAVRSSILSKQWARVWSLGVPFLIFNDEGNSNGHDDDRRKLLFIDFVDSCLKHYERNKLKLDRFMLRMRYDCELVDSTRIDKWFCFVVDQCVKEFSISIRRKHDSESESTYYRIPHTILNAQYLTHLYLQHVRIPESTDLISLPLLKKMTLNDVLFDCLMRSDRSLWKGCPSIESLLLESCSFSSLGSWMIAVNNSSLRFLRIINCKSKSIHVTAENLESFELTSVFPQLLIISLHSECVKLKYISVHAQHSEKTCFSMHGSNQENLKANIYIPSLLFFSYDGYLLPNDIISVKARKPFTAVLNLNVRRPNFLPPMMHFPTWRDFLQNSDCCTAVQLHIHHDAVAGALTFPENFRKTFTPPLLNMKLLLVSVVRLRCPQTMANISALTDPLRWMAPHADIGISYWDYDEADEPEFSDEDE